MQFCRRGFGLLSNCRPCGNATAAWSRNVDDHLALLRIVDRLGQIDFPDPEERSALFVLRHQTGAAPEHHNDRGESVPEHVFLLPHVLSLRLFRYRTNAPICALTVLASVSRRGTLPLAAAGRRARRLPPLNT